MNRRYQVFISSTYVDLIEERRAVYEMCLRMGHFPMGMERFNANDDTQWEVIKRTIDLSDYYCIIVAWRYGTTTDDGISFTEKEYDYAVSVGVPVSRFIIDPDVGWAMQKSPPEQRGAVVEFKEKLRRGRMVKFWNDSRHLAVEFNLTLSEEINLRPRPGWIRNEGYDATLKEMTQLIAENKAMREELERSAKTTGDDDKVKDAIAKLRVKAVFFVAGHEEYGCIVEQDELFYVLGRQFATGANLAAINSEIQTNLDKTVVPTIGTIQTALDDFVLMSLIEVTWLNLSGRSMLDATAERVYAMTELGKKVYIAIDATEPDIGIWHISHVA